MSLLTKEQLPGKWEAVAADCTVDDTVDSTVYATVCPAVIQITTKWGVEIYEDVEIIAIS